MASEVRPMGLNSRGMSTRSADSLVDPLVGNSSQSSKDPLTVVDSGLDAAAEQQKKIRSYEEGRHHRHHDWKRHLHPNQISPVRMKSFHGKYSDQGLAFLDDAINEWLDANPEIDIKFVTSTVGMFDGKIKENALVLNVWY